MHTRLTSRSSDVSNWSHFNHEGGQGGISREPSTTAERSALPSWAYNRPGDLPRAFTLGGYTHEMSPPLPPAPATSLCRCVSYAESGVNNADYPPGNCFIDRAVPFKEESTGRSRVGAGCRFFPLGQAVAQIYE